jgi:PAS domain S-box-containing protein
MASSLPQPAAVRTDSTFVTRLVVGTLIINLLVAAIAGLSVYQGWLAYQESAAVSTRNLADVLERQIAASIDKIDFALRAAVDEVERLRAAGNLTPMALDPFLARARSRLPEVAVLRVADFAGEVKLGVESVPAPVPLAGDRDYFVRLRDDPHAGLAISAAVVGRISNRWMVFFARRVNRPDGSFAGVVFAGVDLDYFNRILSGVDVGARGGVGLRDARMALVASYPAPDKTGRQIGDTAVSPELRQMVDAGKTAGTYVGRAAPDNLERINSFRKAADYPLYIIVGLVTDDYLGAWRRTAMQLAGLALLFAVITCALSWLIYRGWRRRTLAVRALVRRTAESRRRGDLLQEVQRVADLGYFVYDMIADVWESSQILDRVLGIDAGYRRDLAHWLELVVPESRQELQDYLQAQIARRENFNKTYRIMRPSDHQERWVFGLADIEYDPAGKPLRMIGTIRDITERRRAEDELRRSEDKFAKMFHASPLPISLARLRDGLYLDVNEAHVEAYGWTREQLIGHTSDEVGLWLSTADRQRWLDAFAAYGRTKSFEMTLRNHAGETRTVHLFAERLELDGEECVLTLHYDITERRRAEDELRKLSRAVEQSPVSIVITDKAGSIEYVNPRVEAVTGYSKAELIGHNPRILQSGQTPPRVYEELWKTIGQGGEWHGELCNRKKDGELYWEYASISGLVDERGQIAHFIAVKEDITQRKQIEQELRRSEDKFAKIFHACPLPISFAFLRDGRYLEINEAYIQTYGWTREQFVGHTSIEIGLWPTAEDRQQWMKKFVAEGRTKDYEVTLHNSAGEPRSVLLSAEKLEIGGEECVLSLVYDISERKRAEDEVRRLAAELESRVRERTAELTAANKELESFAYSVSHDLRAPLRGINGFSALLLDEYGDKLDGPGHEYLSRIRRAATRLDTLINDLLQLSRLTRQEMRREAVDLGRLAREILDERIRSEPQREVDVRVQPACKAYGDPQLLRVVMENLIDNAWKYTKNVARPQIEFGRETGADEHTFFVRDNGAGFDMAYADRLFQLFQRLHREEEFQGTGVGLSIAKRLIERHGGRIWATGALGEGATFYFTL